MTRGLGASRGLVDDWNRYESLRRMAEEGAGAAAAERAQAARHLRKLYPNGAPPNPATRRSGWSAGPWARSPTRSAPGGVPLWQTDPRGDSTILREDFADLNYAKKAVYEHALRGGHALHKVTLWGFDGAYLRSAFVVFTSREDAGFAGQVLEAWGKSAGLWGSGPFDAVILAGLHQPGEDQRWPGPPHAWVVRIRGQDVARRHIWVEYDSFNQNPGNDPGFARRLRTAIG